MLYSVTFKIRVNLFIYLGIIKYKGKIIIQATSETYFNFEANYGHYLKFTKTIKDLKCS